MLANNNEELATLLNNLNNENADTRVRSVISLGNLKDEKAIPALCKTLLEDSDREVRRHAAEALGHIGSEEIMPTLLKALNDADPEIRQQVEIAIGEIDRPAKISSNLLENISQSLKKYVNKPKSSD